jgi:hypothetical protein
MAATRRAEEILDALGLGQSTAPLKTRLKRRKRITVEAEIELAPRIASEMRRDWWNTRYGRWRLEVEEQAMRERFPGFQAVLLDETYIAWVGRLQSALAGGGSYLVYVVYDGFPYLAPRAIIAAPRFVESTPHLLRGQEPCLFRGGGARGYDAASTTAATLVAWTALWIHAYETWRQTGCWPGRGD